MRPLKISPAEWHVMSVLWQRAPALVPTSDIVEVLEQQQGWHSRTIRTLLDRLEEKKAVQAKADGKRYLYSPLISLEEGLRQESRSFLNRFFGGKPAAMLLHFVEESNLSSAEIRKLKEILARKERKP